MKGLFQDSSNLQPDSLYPCIHSSYIQGVSGHDRPGSGPPSLLPARAEVKYPHCPFRFVLENLLPSFILNSRGRFPRDELSAECQNNLNTEWRGMVIEDEMGTIYWNLEE